MKENFTVHSDYQSMASDLKKSLDGFAQNPDYVVKGERNVIKKIELQNSVYNIKKFKTPSFFQGLVYRFLRKSKAKRSFEYAKKLIELQIGTPFPVAFLERFSGGLKESFYISKHLEYDFDFRVLNHNPLFPHRNEILRQAAGFSYQLHENGINFLDHSPGNTLIVDQKNGVFDFYLIDLNRMRFESLDFNTRMRNLRRLWLSKTMIKVMSKEYAARYGKTYEETHALMTKYSRAFQKKVNSKKLRRRRKSKN